MSRNKYTVRLLPVAEEDFSEIVLYIAAENILAAEMVSDKIEKTLRILLHNPFLGHLPHEPELISSGYRFIVVLNYLIFYKIELKTIYIHRIIHGARDYMQLL